MLLDALDLTVMVTTAIRVKERVVPNEYMSLWVRPSEPYCRVRLHHTC